jgi:hypothetical protein
MLNKIKPKSFSVRTVLGSISGRNAAVAHMAGPNITTQAVIVPPISWMIVKTGLDPSIRHITMVSWAVHGIHRTPTNAATLFPSRIAL